MSPSTDDLVRLRERVRGAPPGHSPRRYLYAVLSALKDRLDGESETVIFRFIWNRAWTDAALALVGRALPGWSLCLSMSEGLKHPSVVMGRSYPTNKTVAVEHRTAPFAILDALLAALIAQGGARE